MDALRTTLAVLASIAGFATGIGSLLLMLVLLLASAPNSTPERAELWKYLALGSIGVTALALLGGGLAMYYGRPWTGASIAASPAVIFVVTVIVLTKLGY